MNSLVLKLVSVLVGTGSVAGCATGVFFTYNSQNSKKKPFTYNSQNNHEKANDHYVVVAKKVGSTEPTKSLTLKTSSGSKNYKCKLTKADGSVIEDLKCDVSLLTPSKWMNLSQIKQNTTPATISTEQLKSENQHFKVSVKDEIFNAIDFAQDTVSNIELIETSSSAGATSSPIITFSPVFALGKNDQLKYKNSGFFLSGKTASRSGQVSQTNLNCSIHPRATEITVNLFATNEKPCSIFEITGDSTPTLASPTFTTKGSAISSSTIDASKFYLVDYTQESDAPAPIADLASKRLFITKTTSTDPAKKTFITHFSTFKPVFYTSTSKDSGFILG